MPSVQGEVIIADDGTSLTRDEIDNHVEIERTGQQTTYSQLDGRLTRFNSFASYRTYRNMRRDPTLWICRQLATAPVISASWSIEEREYAPAGAADLIDEIFQPMRLDFLTQAVLGCSDYGFQGFECVWGVDHNSQVRPRKLKQLLPDLTDILICPKTGTFQGYVQCDPFGTEQFFYVPQAFHTVLNYEGTDWFGEPDMEVAREAYNDWKTVNKAAERYDRKIAGSHWIVHFPNGTSKVRGSDTDNLLVAQGIINALQASGAVAIPSTLTEYAGELSKDSKEAWRIELLGDSSGSKAAFIDRMKYLDSLKARAFCLPERAIQEGSFGTKAEAEAHANFAITLCERKHKQLVQFLNRGPVNQTLAANYGRAFIDSVYIEPAPLTDMSRQVLIDMYKIILANPEVMMAELQRLDMEQFADRLGLPVKPVDTDIDLTDTMLPVVDPLAPTLPVVQGAAPDNVGDVIPFAAGYDPDQPRGDDGRWGAAGFTRSSIVSNERAQHEIVTQGHIAKGLAAMRGDSSFETKKEEFAKLEKREDIAAHITKSLSAESLTAESGIAADKLSGKLPKIVERIAKGSLPITVVGVRDAIGSGISDKQDKLALAICRQAGIPAHESHFLMRGFKPGQSSEEYADRSGYEIPTFENGFSGIEFVDDEVFGAMVLAYADMLELYDPNQPRDGHGRWTAEGGPDGPTGPTHSAVYKSAQRVHKANQKALERAKASGDAARINDAQRAHDTSKAEQVKTGRAYRAYLKARNAADTAQAAAREVVSRPVAARLGEAWHNLDRASGAPHDEWAAAVTAVEAVAAEMGGNDQGLADARRVYEDLNRTVEAETVAAMDVVAAVGVPKAERDALLQQAEDNVPVEPRRGRDASGLKPDQVERIANMQFKPADQAGKDEWGSSTQYGGTHHQYKFDAPNGDKARVDVTAEPDSFGGTGHYVSFQVGGSFSVTDAQGARDALKVFDKVGTSLIALARKEEPNSIRFSAAYVPLSAEAIAAGRVDDGKGSRQHLYDKLAQNFVKANPGYTAIGSGYKFGTKEYLVIKRENLAAAKRLAGANGMPIEELTQ